MFRSDPFDKERNPEIPAETLAAIENDISKSVKSKTKDMRVPEYPIRIVVHEDIRYFLYKIRKGQFSSQAMKNWRKDWDSNLSEKLKQLLHRTFFGFSQLKIFSARIRW